MAKRKPYNGLLSDLGIIALSIFIAIILARTDALITLFTATHGLELVGSFIAGLFFTSIFTTAPAIATLGELAQLNSVFLVALFGAAGALIGDFIIYQFVKDRVAEHLMELLKTEGVLRRTRTLLKRSSFRWIAFLLGGLVIASPLPDELGISLIGFSKMSVFRFAVLSYLFNFLGILLIGLAAQAL
ncbi:hypothetical protein A2671_00140 [Candidatus Kaiserbacteria bacterium RIFCSPHIGHO2_01_FULL_49_13]|uniref:TVP38/TMEM64 family membrane protein n=1 Tax=Candidatus Kaiserbacteria bacterium RIFCSPHIGHO2_01_FULL_49_13 TaxID=1798477 RepID=A0A1F6CED5_9BACT|nr:MAG: hypothetical protein A2671_00140 [Candidatus Kaiserbacteria bacterium RIFCSPHIGHO2_01_FULL_49_13]